MMRSNNKSTFLNQLFDTKTAHFDQDYQLYFIEESDIIKYYKSKSRKVDGIFDQDKIQDFADEETGFITRESFEKGIANEIENISLKLKEVAQKRVKANEVIQEKRKKKQSDAEKEQFKLKICRLERRASSSNLKDKTIEIQISCGNITLATEEKVFDSNVCFFLKDVFQISSIKLQDMITIKLIEKTHLQDEIRGYAQLQVSDFKDQKVHKRSYHLKSQKRNVSDCDIQVKALFLFDPVQRNREKLSLREKAFEGIQRELSEMEIILTRRLRGLQNCNDQSVLEHLNLINFRNEETLPTVNDIRVYKDFDSETSSVYNEFNQHQIFFENESEEEIEFKHTPKILQLDDSPNSQDSCNFSFEKSQVTNKDEDIDQQYNSHQQMLLKHLLPEEANQGFTAQGSLSTNNKDGKNQVHSQTNVYGPSYMSPRFNENLTIASALASEAERNERRGLQELNELHKKTTNLMNQFDNSKIKNNKGNQNQTKSKEFYDEVSQLNSKDLLKFRMFAKGLISLQKISPQLFEDSNKS